MSTARSHQKHCRPAHARPALRVSAIAASLACGLLLSTGPAHALNVVWAGGNGAWTNPLAWIGHLYPDFSSDAVYIDGGNLLDSAVTLSSSITIGQLFIDGGDSLTVTNGGTLGLTGSTLSNNGRLTLAATSSTWARLAVGTALTLSGSGSTVLASDPSGHRAVVSGGPLTIAAGHTVRGAGDLGSTSFGSMSVINQGTVIAEGGTLNTYQVGGQSFNNTAGLVQVAGGSALVANGQFSGGTVQSQATGTDTALLGGSTFNDVALRGALAVQNSLSLSGGTIHDSLLVAQATLNAIGTLNNEGTLTLTATNSGPARLNIGSALTLAGSGSTVLASDPSGHRAAISGGLLTIAAGQTVRGAGDLGSASYGSVSVINQGTVIAEGGTLNTYQVGAQKFDNTAGLVQIASGAALIANGQFVGGSLQSLATGTDTALLGGSTFNDVALRGALAVQNSLSLSGGTIHDSLLVAQATLNATGTLTNNGVLTLAGTPSGWGRMAIGTAVTLAGTGTTVLTSDASGYRGVVGGGSLTIASGQTVRGAGDLGSTSFGGSNVVNQGRVIAEGGTLNLYQTGGQSFDNTAGLVQIGDGATLAVNGKFVGGSIQGLGNSTLSGSRFDNVTLTGSLAVAAGSMASVSGTLTNNGSLSLAASTSAYSRLDIADDTTLAGSGVTSLASASSGHRGVISGNGVLTIGAGHSVRGAGDLGSTTFGGLTVINQGTLIAEGGTLSAYSGSNAFDNQAGVLVVQADSHLSFNSALSLADASQLRISVTGSSGLASVGLLQLSGNAAFDGQVLFDLSGYSATVGDSFTFATYTGSYSGAFDGVSATGYTFSTVYADHQVTATITGVSAVPEPQGWAMLMAGLFIVGSRARRRAAKR